MEPLIFLLFAQADPEKTQALCAELETTYGLSGQLQVGACTTARSLPDQPPALIFLLGPADATAAYFDEIHETTSHPVITLDTTRWSSARLALAVAKVVARVSPSSTALSQAVTVQRVQLKTQSTYYNQMIRNRMNATITGDSVDMEGRIRGKVRDRYNLPSHVALVTTDRQSGFDRQLAQVPYKGAVLNLTSAFWFEQTQHIIPNHLVATPHAYVTIGRPCQPFPIEFVVRSYMTGSTGTSIWKHYQSGVRNYCGHVLPDGMVKNQKLATNLLTPTTKEEEHDRPISLADIVKENWMTQADLDVCAKAALEIFALGQQIAAARGLILVDTKYEFGRDLATGEIRLIDEVHTPDSSRYWLASTYEQRIAADQEPENIDKEFLRLWFRERCDPYQDAVLPEPPAELVAELSRRYILLYELITGKSFDFEGVSDEAAITAAIQEYL